MPGVASSSLAHGESDRVATAAGDQEGVALPMGGKHRKGGGASKMGCAVIMVFAMPLLISLATAADQARSLVG
jgi:hypothetical protein